MQRSDRRAESGAGSDGFVAWLLAGPRETIGEGVAERRNVGVGAARRRAPLQRTWDSDDRRRELEPDVVARTGRHAGRWIVVRDGRVVASPGKAGRIFRRELSAGGRRYWVAPPGTVRPRIP
jgi:hypothetical protein